MAHTAYIRVVVTESKCREVDPSQWEVICPDCGDDGGPVDGQPIAAQRIRGPYQTKQAAWETAMRHRLLLR